MVLLSTVFFVPWLNESVRLLEEGIATKEVIDSVCCKVFGIGMGPFALMNATGVPVAYHAEKTLEVFGSLYTVSSLLQTQALSGKPWEIKNEAEIKVDTEVEKNIRERMLGVVLFVCSQMFEEKVCSAADMNRGAKIGLRWKRGPVDTMKTLGKDEVRRLVVQIAGKYKCPFPAQLMKIIGRCQLCALILVGAKL